MTLDLGTRTIAAQGAVYGPGIVEVPNQEIKDQLEARMKELDDRDAGTQPSPEAAVPTTTSEPEIGTPGTEEEEEVTGTGDGEEAAEEE